MDDGRDQVADGIGEGNRGTDQPGTCARCLHQVLDHGRLACMLSWPDLEVVALGMTCDLWEDYRDTAGVQQVSHLVIT